MNFYKKQFSHTNIKDCSLIKVEKVEIKKALFNVLDNSKGVIPFDIKRVFYIYGVPQGATRGSHAHLTCHELIVAAAGSFKVSLFDGKNKKTISIEQPNFGLHIPNGIWAEEFDFSPDSVCLVLTSEEYNENDYIRDITDYLKRKAIV